MICMWGWWWWDECEGCQCDDCACLDALFDEFSVAVRRGDL